MARMSGVVAALVAFGAVACGTAAPSSPAPKLAAGPAAETSDATSVTSTLAAKIEAKDEPKEEPASGALPEGCAGEGTVKDLKTCLPPTEFAKKLCGDIYPEVSLGLFAKSTPWTRVWLAGDVDAWNASGGRSQRTKLAFDEEVIVLSKHAPNGHGIVMVGAAASYDVVRADGTCFTVMDGEITTRKPPQPKLAPPPWSRLEEGTRRALLASSPKVKSSFEAFGKACAGDNTKACDKAERVFAQNVADAVRGGAASLPLPARRP